MEPTVLLLHNRYREPGGEERSVSEIAALLRSRGHHVEVLERSSETLAGARGRARAGAAMLRGGTDAREVAGAIERSGATVLHAHNINPLFGPRALAAAREAGARVVMHLHNYRLFCAIAIAYRDGAICTRCRERNTLPGVRLRCRGNVAEAAVYATALATQQKRVLEHVDRFVVPSRAAAARLGTLGMPLDRLDVLHNFLSEEEFAGTSVAAEGKHALVAGRLVEEKGFDVAIEAAALARVPLVVAGAGADAGRLERLALRFAPGAPIQFRGRLSPAEMAAARRQAALALAPSRWDDPCPYSVLEAMAAGLPVLAANAGGLGELVGKDATLPANATERWAKAMSDLWKDRDRRRETGEDALARARRLFGPDRFYSGLMEVYERAGARE